MDACAAPCPARVETSTQVDDERQQRLRHLPARDVAPRTTLVDDDRFTHPNPHSSSSTSDQSSKPVVSASMYAKARRTHLALSNRVLWDSRVA